MHEATIDLSIIWTVELSSLLGIFGTWCFYQSYPLIMCGVHHVVHFQMDNKKLWFKDAIERETVELIL